MYNYIACANNFEYLNEEDKELFEKNRIKLKELVEIKNKEELNEDEDNQLSVILIFFKDLKQKYGFGYHKMEE